MKFKTLAFIVILITLLGPFQIAFLYNEDYSNPFKTLMFVLALLGFLGSFIFYTLGEKKTEH
jgi:hypothetical protein